MTIKELEQLVGLPRASIRFYEQEGFLSPQRLKNNYRDYSPADVHTLKRIKLLRQLHLDLDSIRRLESGELTLTQALEEQLEALDSDRGALDRAGEVCQSLLDSKTEYAALDPEPWLEELERRPAPSGPHLERQRDSLDNIPSPWRRFFARRLDSLLYQLPWLAIQLYILHDYQTADPVSPVLYYAAFIIPFVFIQVFFLSSLAQTLTAFVLEPLFLTLFGATPGKWIMGLEIRNADGGRLTLTQARNRTMTVIFRGEGFYLPIYSLWRNYRSYRACKDGQILSWDEDLCYTARPKGLAWRIPLLAAGTALALLSQNVLVNVSYQPPHPNGISSPAQLAENYNAFHIRRVPGASEDILFNRDGQWVIELPWHDTPSWVVDTIEFSPDSLGTSFSYTAVLDPAVLEEEGRNYSPYNLDQAIDGNLILALSCAARPWPLLTSKQEVERMKEELEQLCSTQLTPPVTRLDQTFSCGVRVQAELNAPGYVSMDGTAAELIWGEQPNPAQPITVQVTMSLY